MPLPPHRLVLLPGIGADGRMFTPQREAFPRLEVPDWLPHRRGEGLASYGRRMADVVDPDPADARPLLLGGASFGGMVAQEVARELARRGRAARAIILLSSALSGRAVPPWLVASERLSRVAPRGALDLFPRLIPSARVMERLPLRLAHRLSLAMRRDADTEYIRWAAAAILRWPGCEPAAPVFWIHGSRDLTLPIGPARPDRLVRGAGHLMNMSHARETNAFIRAVARRALGERRA